MKIYLDNCCYNRLYDNKAHMEQVSVQAEITSIMAYGAQVLFGNRLYFDTKASKALIKKYLKGKNNG